MKNHLIFNLYKSTLFCLIWCLLCSLVTFIFLQISFSYKCSSLWLRSTLLCIYTTLSSSIHLLIESNFVILNCVDINMNIHVPLQYTAFSFSGICMGIISLHHMIILFLNFWETFAYIHNGCIRFDLNQQCKKDSFYTYLCWHLLFWIYHNSSLWSKIEPQWSYHFHSQCLKIRKNKFTYLLPNPFISLNCTSNLTWQKVWTN